jgi:5'-nucleotidase
MDNRASPYYWLAFSRDKFEIEAGSDVEALSQGYVSVTPIKINYTDEAEHARLNSLLG